MIEAILPAAAIAVEAFDDELEVELFPEERELIEGAVEKRRREFATGRGCAHRALERLGAPASPVLRGERGEPLWPDGLLGSITHCDGYRACAVGRAAELAALGIDAEPHRALPQGLLDRLAGAEETAQLRELARATPTIRWDRLLFSAKEATYKAWYPLTERRLGFEDTVLTIDPDHRAFAARLRVPGALAAGTEVAGFDGRWLIGDGLVLTAVAVRTQP